MADDWYQGFFRLEWVLNFCVALRCSVLQCVAVWCRVFQWVAVCCSATIQRSNLIGVSFFVVCVSVCGILRQGDALSHSGIIHIKVQIDWSPFFCVWVFLCVALCGRVWQCVAVSCSVLQCADLNQGFSQLESVLLWCSVLQRVAVCCSLLQCAAVCCNMFEWNDWYKSLFQFGERFLVCWHTLFQWRFRV